mmetsp:Transcript_18820/g.38755  ORF Transcript_18820/g.38755 Transcript_18820/m.38755 type:complete len:264 (+) Transcript_18820:1320-2111(+)
MSGSSGRTSSVSASNTGGRSSSVSSSCMPRFSGMSRRFLCSFMWSVSLGFCFFRSAFFLLLPILSCLFWSFCRMLSPVRSLVCPRSRPPVCAISRPRSFFLVGSNKFSARCSGCCSKFFRWRVSPSFSLSVSSSLLFRIFLSFSSASSRRSFSSPVFWNSSSRISSFNSSMSSEASPGSSSKSGVNRTALCPVAHPPQSLSFAVGSLIWRTTAAWLLNNFPETRLLLSHPTDSPETNSAALESSIGPSISMTNCRSSLNSLVV